ncbi:hypothetical protein NK214_12015 [Chromobacterium sp. S0633]|uniref:hypothetical protein n=1 Tax=Chromobacterium sp. S0633 TaxID=2957805 RepID=UPI00209D340D|nr:hypothetical protein [Chromobacterium sp. S0633]MCP1290915.1 hypothetical protein [Chromobacterium sp. S0633]
MTWRTVGLACQVFDGPASYVNAWDIGFQKELRRIAGIRSLTERRRALKDIEAQSGAPARKRMEAALARLWAARDTQ